MGAELGMSVVGLDMGPTAPSHPLQLCCKPETPMGIVTNHVGLSPPCHEAAHGLLAPRVPG